MPGTVYIAMVATLPGQQGKGYADTVMRHAIAQGRQTSGAASTTLHATAVGEPVYRAMGYAPAAGFTLVGQQQERSDPPRKYFVKQVQAGSTSMSFCSSGKSGAIAFFRSRRRRNISSPADASSPATPSTRNKPLMPKSR